MSSPCKAGMGADSCELSNVHDFCIHCGRTTEDLTNWQSMSHENKKQANINAKKRLKGLWHK
tara:strand:+ start:451 stop:636 length:186 start_codon:yes stop_codon:yes gene_type:complete